MLQYQIVVNDGSLHLIIFCRAGRYYEVCCWYSVWLFMLQRIGNMIFCFCVL